MTEMQAAIGTAHMKKLPAFVEKRRHNWRRLHAGLESLAEFFVLPSSTPGSDPSWFGFPLTIRPTAPFSRDDLLRRLQQRRIATRLLFGGDLRRQPAYQHTLYRTVGDLPVTNVVLHDMFWIGVYPGLTAQMLDFVIDTIITFVDEKRRSRQAA